MQFQVKQTIIFLALLLLFPTLEGRDQDDIRRSGTIYVAFTPEALNNINYDLALEFARYLNVELKKVVISWDEAFMLDGRMPEGMISDPDLVYTPDALKKADIICTTFTIKEWRKKLFGFAETLPSAEILVVRTADGIPREYNELTGKRIGYMHATTFEQNLQAINAELDKGMILVENEDTDESKRFLKEGKVDGIILDADEALDLIASDPSVYSIAFPISGITQTAWATEKNNPLGTEVEHFFGAIAGNGVLDEIFLRNFGISYQNYRELLEKNQRRQSYQRDLAEILASKKLVVALRERDFIYHERGQKQFMHALAEEFADHLGVSLEYVIVPEFSEYWQTKEGKIFKDSAYVPEWFSYFDLAADLISSLDWRREKVNLIPVYPSAYTVIAKTEQDISSVDDLHDLKGVTGIGTAYEDILLEHGIDNYYYENINNFVGDVVSGKADYTMLLNAFNDIKAVPDVEAKFNLGSMDICWGLRKDQPELQKELESFLSRSRDNGLISSLLTAMKGNRYNSPGAFISSYYQNMQTGELPFVDYGTANGLPQEDIYSIFQDQLCYLWFGTNSGAVRYNGREMQVFNHVQGMPSNLVRDISQDSSGHMYFATSNGIARLDEHFRIETLFEGISFNKILIDSRDHKWFISDEGLYTERRKGEIRHLNSSVNGLPDLIHSLEEDPVNDRLFLGTGNGIYLFDTDSEELRQLGQEECYALFFDANDSVWISGASGLQICHRDDLLAGEAHRGRHLAPAEKEESFGLVSEITANSAGDTWMISDSEILKFLASGQEPVVFNQGEEIRNNKILSFLIDREDNFWIGYSGGLQRLSNHRVLRNFSPDILDSHVSNILQDGQGRLWFFSNSGTYYYLGQDPQLYAPSQGGPEPRFAGTEMENGNILMVNSQGLYEVNVRDLRIVRHREFDHPLKLIENIFVSSSGDIFLLTGINGIIYHLSDFHAPPRSLMSRYTSNIFQLVEYQGRVIGGNNTGFVTFNGSDFELLQESKYHIWSLYAEEESLWVGTGVGIGQVQGQLFRRMLLFPLDRELVIKSILPARDRNYLWLGTNQGFGYYHLEKGRLHFMVNSTDGLNGNEITPGGLFLDNNNLLWIGSYHGLSNFNLMARHEEQITPATYIERILLNGDSIRIENGHTFAHDENNFVFEISALLYADESSLEYEYYLRGKGNSFASYHRGPEYEATYNNLSPGRYEFIYKARGRNRIWAYAEEFEFSIRKAWYNTWIFRISLTLVILAGAYLIFRLRIRTIEMQKKRLEQQVHERTRELEDANTEIQAKQKEITDSIDYAQRIQTAILPEKMDLGKYFSEQFIVFLPKDQVSGDFYWFREVGGRIAIVGADCTGHGIPGAFLSMLGITLLNEKISAGKTISPAGALDELRQKIKEMLDQKGHMGEQKDGMEMAFILLDPKKQELKFAGANSPLYLVRKKSEKRDEALEEHLSKENGDYYLFEIKGDRQPIGIHLVESDFTEHKINIRKGDSLYIFSDGLIDQYGGPNRKRYLSTRLKKILLSIQDEEMEEQQSRILSEHCEWRGFNEQIDDISMIGIRI